MSKLTALISRQIHDCFSRYERLHSNDAENTVFDLTEYPELGVKNMDVPRMLATVVPVGKIFTSKGYWMRTGETPARFIFLPVLYRRKHGIA